MIHPALTTLLSNPARKHFGQLGPGFAPVDMDEIEDHFIFLARPRSFEKNWIKDFRPSFKQLL
jgi:hypothetical protein